MSWPGPVEDVTSIEYAFFLRNPYPSCLTLGLKVCNAMVTLQAEVQVLRLHQSTQQLRLALRSNSIGQPGQIRTFLSSRPTFMNYSFLLIDTKGQPSHTWPKPPVILQNGAQEPGALVFGTCFLNLSCPDLNYQRCVVQGC